MDNFGRTLVGWFFWLLLWILASTVGVAVGWIIGLPGAEDAYRAVNGTLGSAIFGAIVGTSIGAVVGALQWPFLQGKISQAGWWVLASTVGWAVGLALGWAWVGLLTAGAVAGAVVGTLQWLVLRGKISQAGWWLPACTVGWAVGWAVGILIFKGMGGDGTPAVAGVPGWAGGGCITGVALVWLLYKNMV